MIVFFTRFFKKPVAVVKKAVVPPKIVSAIYEKEHMTVKYDDDSVREYEGSCTVWRHYPMMKRCNVFKEGELLDNGVLEVTSEN